MKHIYALLLLFVCSMASFAQKASIEGIIYKVSGANTAKVVGIEKDMTVANIKPSVTIEGKEYNVTEIGNSAFAHTNKFKQSKLYTVTIPEGIVSIGMFALQGTSISEIVIPNSVKSLGAGAFSNCKSLLTVVFPDTPCEITPSRLLAGTFEYSDNIINLLVELD